MASAWRRLPVVPSTVPVPKLRRTRQAAALGDGVRIVTSPDGHRSLNVAATIYNERSCSQAECHAHPERVRVLGVLDVALRLDVLDQEAAQPCEATSSSPRCCRFFSPAA